jgi:hypothetical protein
VKGSVRGVGWNNSGQAKEFRLCRTTQPGTANPRLGGVYACLQQKENEEDSTCLPAHVRCCSYLHCPTRPIKSVTHLRPPDLYLI